MELIATFLVELFVYHRSKRKFVGVNIREASYTGALQ